jgi:tetratricopeptide (TPR) repeat protein
MARYLRSRILFLTRRFVISLLVCACCAPALQAQLASPPPIPDGSASAETLEMQGDQLRAEKRFLDSIDYYNVALAKKPSALLWNKKGMSYLLLQHPDQAAKCFDHAIKLDKHAPEGYNNRGYIEQMKKNYDKAIKYYMKALKLRPTDAVFQYNMGSSYFGKHDYVRAAQAYKVAFALDPDIFNRVSRTGVMAQATSPEDRAAFSFMVARMYAQAGDFDRSLEYLRKAMEDGYKDINKVYTESEFATLRTDKRFEELMAQRPQAIQ